jgi:hypothetical protein
VLDAIGLVNGLPAVSSKTRIWVARPSPADGGCDQVLPVDWDAITQGGSTATNYQLLPGDRVYVKAEPWTCFDNTVARVLAPFERMLRLSLPTEAACPPCDAEFRGYFPACWRRWPAPCANCPGRCPPWVAVAPQPGAVGDGAVPAPAEPAPQAAPAPPSGLPSLTVPAGQPRLSISLPSQPDPLLPGGGQETTR